MFQIEERYKREAIKSGTRTTLVRMIKLICLFDRSANEMMPPHSKVTQIFQNQIRFGLVPRHVYHKHDILIAARPPLQKTLFSLSFLALFLDYEFDLSIKINNKLI